LGYLSGARRWAATDLEFQAGTTAVSKPPRRAGAHGKDLLDEAQGLAQSLGRIKGADIARPIVAVPPHSIHGRERFVHRETEAHVLFVVAKDHVVTRLVLSDEAVLQEISLFLRVRDDALEIDRLCDDAIEVKAAVRATRKVGPDPAAQVLGLAHIEDIAAEVEEDVDPGLLGQSVGF